MTEQQAQTHVANAEEARSDRVRGQLNYADRTFIRVGYDTVDLYIVFDATTDFVDMTIYFGVCEDLFAIVAMASLPQGVNRQILRNAICDLKSLIQTSYNNINMCFRK